MPRWGLIKASEPKPIKVDIGWRCMGDRFVAAIDFHNDTMSPIELQKVTSGCGCTAAGPVSNTVAPGATIPIIFRVKRERLSRFEVTSEISWGLSKVVVAKSGEIRPRIVFDDLTIQKSGKGTVSYRIKDKRISRMKLGFALANRSFEISNVNKDSIEISKLNKNLFPTWLTIVPMSKDVDLPPQQLRVTHVGSFKVVPPLVTAAQDKGIRIFLIGGVGDTKGATTAQISTEDLTKAVSVNVEKKETMLTVNLDPLDLKPGTHRVSVKIGDIKFSFHLRQVAKR